MWLTRPNKCVCDPPNTKPALNPPIANGYCRPRNTSVPLPPDAPMNHPPFITEIRTVPLSA